MWICDYTWQSIINLTYYTMAWNLNDTAVRFFIEFTGNYTHVYYEEIAMLGTGIK